MGAALVSTASAGAWVSGGGEVVGTTRNTWFLHNTPEVKYCLARTPDAFAPSDASVSEALHAAVRYWREEFSQTTAPAFPELKVATQTFTRVDCGRGEDLRIHLGGLPDEAAARLGGVDRYLSLLVRTDYDAKTMRGRGFLYLAPDAGANAHSVLKSHGGWSKSGLLKHALAHELGHLFGLQHDHHALSLMRADFVEASAKSSLPLGPSLVRYLTPESRFIRCWVDPLAFVPAKARAFFGLKDDAKCLTVHSTAVPNGVPPTLVIAEAGVKHDRLTGIPAVGPAHAVPAGTISVAEMLRLKAATPVSRIVFPTGRAVFAQAPEAVTLFGQVRRWHGIYTSSKTNETRPVAVEQKPIAAGAESFRISGELDGKIHLNLLDGAE